MTTRTAKSGASKRGLGRGLESLIPAAAVTDAGFAQVGIDEITPNPQQPRANFDEESLASLADSIGTVGVLQPVVVRRNSEGGYVLVAGERRWRAARCPIRVARACHCAGRRPRLPPRCRIFPAP